MKNIHVLPTDKPSRLIKTQDNDFIKLNTNVPNWFEINLNTSKQNIYITSDEKIKVGGWFINILSNQNVVKCESIAYEEQLQEMNNCSSDKCKFRKIILTTDQDLIKDGVQAIDDAFLEWFVKNSSCEMVEVRKEYKDGYGNWYTYQDDFKFTDLPIRYKIIIPKEVDWSDLENSGLDKSFQLIEEPKQELSVRLQNSLKQFNLTLEDAINTEPHRLKQIGFGNRSIIELQGLKPKQETLDNARREYVSDINCGFYSEQIVDTIKAFSSDAFEQGYKFAQEQNKELFSKEEVLEQLNLLYSMKNSLVDTFTDKNDYITMKWFEQFK